MDLPTVCAPDAPLSGGDLGGTKYEHVVLAPGLELKELHRERVETEQHRGYEHVLNRIAHHVEKVERACGIRSERVGVGTPGTLDASTQTLRGSNTQCLNGKPFLRDLAAILNREVVMDNDANLFALAEAHYGAGVGAKVMFGVILGTGVGGAITINGRIWRGAQGIAGEWGHNPLGALTGADSPCYCGRHNCVERILCGPANEVEYYLRTGRMTPLQVVAARSESADPDAKAIRERIVTAFGRGIATVVNILDPDVVVLGGGVSNLEFLYSEGLEAALPHIFNPHAKLALRKNCLGDSAGAIGAALLTTGRWEL